MAYQRDFQFSIAPTGPMDLAASGEATQRVKTWDAIIGAAGAVGGAIGRVKAKEQADKNLADVHEATMGAQDYNNKYLSKLDGPNLVPTLDAKIKEVADSDRSQAYKNTFTRKLVGYREGYGKGVADQEATARLRTSAATVADIFAASSTSPIPLESMRQWVTDTPELGVPPDQVDEVLALGFQTYAVEEFSKSQSLVSIDETKISIDKELEKLVGSDSVTRGPREARLIANTQSAYKANYLAARKGITDRSLLNQTKAEIASETDVTTFLDGDRVSFTDPVDMKTFTSYVQNNGKADHVKYRSLVEHQKKIEAYKSNKIVLNEWDATKPLPISGNKEQIKIATQAVKNSVLMSWMQGNAPKAQQVIAAHPNIDTGLGNHILSGLNSSKIEDAVKMNTMVEAHLSTEAGRKMLAHTLNQDQFSEMYLHVGLNRVYGTPKTTEEYNLRQQKITSATVAYKSHERVDRDTRDLIDKKLKDLPPQVSAPITKVAKLLYHSGSSKEIEKVLDNYLDATKQELPSMDGTDIELFDSGNLKLNTRDQEVLGFVVSDVANHIAEQKPYFDKENAIAISHPDGSVSFYNKTDPTIAIERVMLVDMVNTAATSAKFKKAMEEEHKFSRRLMESPVGALIKGTQTAVSTGVDVAPLVGELPILKAMQVGEKAGKALVEDALMPLLDYLKKKTPKGERRRSFIRG